MKHPATPVGCSLILFSALSCCAPILPAQTNCDSTDVPTLSPPPGLVDTDTLLRESGCTPGPLKTRTPLILIHGLDGDSSMPPSSDDLTMFEFLSLYLAADPTFVSNYKIFTYNYLSDIHPVSEIGAALETWMDYFRTNWDPYNEGNTPFDRDVVILGHSMGGLVARALMNSNTVSAGAQAGVPAGERVLRLIALATPHHGSALANSTTLRLHGQSNAGWTVVFDTIDSSWGLNCSSCETDPASPNRGDLLADNYYAHDVFSSTPSLYTGEDVNVWLNGLPPTYNDKIDAYYGVLGSYGDVGTYGTYPAVGLQSIETELASLALQLGAGSGGAFGTGGVSLSDLSTFNELLQVTSVILERIDQNSWSSDITSVANDGLVPDFSGRFDGATVAKIVSCVNSTHMDMVEGTGGNCTDTAANSTGPLFQLLDTELESVVSLINLPPSVISLSPSTGTAGGAAFTLTVNGTNFVSGATVLWNGTPLPTTFVNSTQLTAGVPASDVATAGTFPVSVANPSPGGATSSALSFTVASVSTSIAISSVSPSSVTLVQGGSSQAVTVNLTETNYMGSVALATSTLPSGVTATITQPGTGSSGSISLQAASNAAVLSNQTITVTASGSGVSSATASFSLTVNPAPAFSLAVSPASATVTAGQPATYTLSVTPVGGFNQQVALSCTGAPSEASCSVSPSSVTLDGADVAKPTVTVTTTAASLATRGRRLVPPRTTPAVPWAAWPLLLAVLASFASRRGRRVRFRLAVLAAAMCLILGWAACGGGGSANTTPPPNSGTPTGTYKLTLTGAYSGSSGNLTQTTTASLTVN
jgi:pimeloyl-ACP methyl ester carboxylesterase